jgi:hypothetical protein
LQKKQFFNEKLVLFKNENPAANKSVRVVIAAKEHKKVEQRREHETANTIEPIKKVRKLDVIK